MWCVNLLKEADILLKKVIKLIRKNGIGVVNCIVNNWKSRTDVLQKICAKFNAAIDVDLHVSIHLNGGRADKKGNRKVGSIKVLSYAKSGW